MNRNLLVVLISVKVLILATGLVINGQCSKKAVRLERLDEQHKVNVYINGSLFTTYQYPLILRSLFFFLFVHRTDQLLQEDSLCYHDREREWITLTR